MTDIEVYPSIYEEHYATANCMELHIFAISGTNSNPHRFYKSAQKDLHTYVYQIFFHHTVNSTFFAYLFLLTSLEKKRIVYVPIHRNVIAQKINNGNRILKLQLTIMTRRSQIVICK